MKDKTFEQELRDYKKCKCTSCKIMWLKIKEIVNIEKPPKE